MNTDYMRILIISILTILNLKAQVDSTNEVGRAFQDYEKWIASQHSVAIEFPSKFREPLENFDSEQIVIGLLQQFESLDSKSGLTNYQYRGIAVLMANPHLIDGGFKILANKF